MICVQRLCCKWFTPQEMMLDSQDTHTHTLTETQIVWQLLQHVVGQPQLCQIFQFVEVLR
jgi:hypothetical protein